MQSIFKILIFCLIGEFNEIVGQVPTFGKCPSVSVVDNFQLENFFGLWYEAEKYPFVLATGGKCITVTYSQLDNGMITINNKQVNRFTGNDGGMMGVASIVSPGKLLLRFPSLPTPLNIDSPYWIIDTDYQTFAVIFSCRELGGFMSAKMVWILTRERQPSLSVMERSYAAMDKNKISKTYLLRTDQSNCV